MLSRRHAMGLALSAATVAVPSAALAFRIVEEDESARVRDLIGACETRNTHEQIVAQILADLGEGDGTGPAVVTPREMACPLCGCRLVLAPPGSGAAPRF